MTKADEHTSVSVATPALAHTLSPPPPLRLLKCEFEDGADPLEKLSESSDKTLQVPNNPEVRSASYQRTSGGPACEELLERSVRVSSLEMEPLPSASASLARKPAESVETTATTTGEASRSSVAATGAVLETFLAELVVDTPFLGVGQDFVSLGNVGELFRSPLLPILVLVRVVLES